MKKIGPPHSHLLSAAEGWMGLGNPAEAKAELARLPKRLQTHPDVLEVRWAVLAQEQDWPQALEVARALLTIAPNQAYGWVHQAYSLRRLADGGLQAAWDALFPAMEKFPKNPIIPYNLACYACQMQQPDKARVLITRAMAIGGRDQIKRMALNDSDLKPIWKEIESL
jgi:predicted Zn-dependent protease